MSAKGSLRPFCKYGHPRVRGETIYANGTCKVCNVQKTRKWQEENREFANELSKKWRDTNPEDFKRSGFKSRFRLTKDFFVHLKNIHQSGLCKICETKLSGNPRECHIDHDHKCCRTGRGCKVCIRGILCRDCNLGLGYFMDRPENLEKAADYLRSHQIPEGHRTSAANSTVP